MGKHFMPLEEAMDVAKNCSKCPEDKVKRALAALIDYEESEVFIKDDQEWLLPAVRVLKQHLSTLN